MDGVAYSTAAVIKKSTPLVEAITTVPARTAILRAVKGCLYTESAINGILGSYGSIGRCKSGRARRPFIEER